MIPFVDLKMQFKHLEPEIRSAIERVLVHGQYIMGPEVFQFEEMLADYCKVKHAITCSSGTDALLMGLMAQNVGPGDAVFTSPFTFFATVEAISLTGATPVFVDIEPSVYNLDCNKLDQAIQNTAKNTNLNPKAIIPVDLFGQPVDYDEIIEVAQKHDLFVLSDAAQSFGASYKGNKVGGITQMTATSFFPAKPLGAYGDGGAVLTNDDETADILRSIRVHGQDGENKYANTRIGLTARLDTIQAAVLIEKLKVLDSEIENRNRVARQYDQQLNKYAGLPYVKPERVSAWAQYSILVPNPDELASTLRDNEIPTARYYPIPMHLQNALANQNYKKGDFPISEDTATKIISLPMHPYLDEAQINTISAVIENAVK